MTSITSCNGIAGVVYAREKNVFSVACPEIDATISLPVKRSKKYDIQRRGRREQSQ